ncbi:UDP-glycosyltransferase 89B2-like [Humulus lupulus]|uniref:UDP-glycosyltransferase 89B2-like n=1 Tax=Humulus lupulus TaxID=3486 RepID=UPI002B411EC6|nr:UDP-glycosyltransferase 89B2-like [Humulus lupulus]
MSGSTTAGATHILVFPFPALGHMIPLLDFTHQIASQTPDLTITILATPKNLSLLNPLLSAHPSIHTLLLPFPPHPAIPDGVENVKDLPPGTYRFVISAMARLREPLTQWFRDHPSPPNAIISDMFLGWTYNLSVDLGIRRITFSPSGAYALALMLSLWRDMPKRRHPDPDGQNEVFSFPEIANCPKYPWWKLSPLYRSYVEGDPESEIVRNSFLGNRASSGLIVNSFSELESVYVDHLKKDLGHDRVWAVGPARLQSDNPTGPTERGGSSSVSANHILSWLDKCGDRKVVYVCFGSEVVLRNDQMEELAKGLETSGVHFVWLVKQPNGSHVDGDCGKVPIGFEDRVAERGLVIKGWAPQVAIMQHRAVGAFFTHCGWNSILEAIVGGVTMLAWPMQADQYANATLLVDHLEVGNKVCEGNQTIPDSAELARAFAKSLGENRVERQRIEELREPTIRATREGGSSTKDLESLVAYLKETTF